MVQLTHMYVTRAVCRSKEIRIDVSARKNDDIPSFMLNKIEIFDVVLVDVVSSVVAVMLSSC
jgi:hypothetical protein